MNFAEQLPLQRPLEGLEVVRWMESFDQLEATLRASLQRRSLVCTSPNRHSRCDAPATRIFWQDAAEYYPCCGAHWPDGQQWTGNTRFRPHYATFLLFAERGDAIEDGSAAKVNRYDRTDAA